jgi:nucleotide-binding universal stress UspA family protein
VKILATTAGSAPAKKRADYIVDLSEKLGADLIVLHVINNADNYTDGERALDIFKYKRKSKLVKSILRVGMVVDTIAETAEVEDVDLIILGFEGGLESHDNISKKLIGRVSQPILLVPDL